MVYLQREWVCIKSLLRVEGLWSNSAVGQEETCCQQADAKEQWQRKNVIEEGGRAENTENKKQDDDKPQLNGA